MPPFPRLRTALGALLGACLRRGWLTGLTAACVLIAIGAGGGLRWLERTLGDAQVRLAASARPADAKESPVAYFEIDDATLANTGRWPWPRAWLGQAIGEIHRAGASVIVLDLLLDEAQETRLRKNGAGGDPVEIHDDDLLAETLRQNGKTVLAANVLPPARWDDAQDWVLAQLRLDPLLTADNLVARAHTAERTGGNHAFGPALHDALQGLPSLKREALRLRLLDQPETSAADTAALDRCRREVLGPEENFRHHRLEAQFFNEAWARHAATRAAANLWPAAAPALAADAPAQLVPPILPLATAARAVGGAPWSPDADGVVRSCLLATPLDDAVAPTLPVMAACLHLGLDPKKMRQENGHWVLPRRDGQGRAADLRIPLLSARAGETWGYPGPRMPVRWSRSESNRLPVGPLIELARLDNDARHNELEADTALLTVATRADSKVPLPLVGDEGLRPLIDLATDDPLSLDHPDTADRRAELHQKILASLAASGTDPGPAWRAASRQAEDCRAAASRLREHLRQACAGKICVLGWTATGSLADFVTTPLGTRVPGMYVQGATIETLLGQSFVTRAPLWAEMALALLLAGAMALSAWRQPLPVTVLAAALALTGVFFAGALALAVGAVRMDAALPLCAGLCAWATCILTRAALYQKQKKRITAQFRNYVSPSLVDHLVAHPELAEMKSENREITCVFTDFAGFTTVSSRLDAGQTALLLNRYLAAATSAFMAHGGNVNKFMGDGILVFWGAPMANPNQALDACRGICACREALAQLAGAPELAGLPPLLLRAGITTGRVMVGDFGAPPARSDYTVIGDSVNLASRLESANKHLGTLTLVGEKTARQAQMEFLLRPIARLKVVGRDTPETVSELLGPLAGASAEQHAAAARSRAVVDAFAAGRFEECLAHIAKAEMAEPAAKWPELYRHACRAHQADPSLTHDGSLTLDKK